MLNETANTVVTVGPEFARVFLIFVLVVPVVIVIPILVVIRLFLTL